MGELGGGFRLPLDRWGEEAAQTGYDYSGPCVTSASASTTERSVSELAEERRPPFVLKDEKNPGQGRGEAPSRAPLFPSAAAAAASRDGPTPGPAEVGAERRRSPPALLRPRKARAGEGAQGAEGPAARTGAQTSVERPRPRRRGYVTRTPALHPRPPRSRSLRL